MPYFPAVLLRLRLIRDGLLWQAGARPLDLLLRKSRIDLEPIEELLGATRTPGSYQTANSIGASLIPISFIGWRADPHLFNIQDLQTLCNGLATLTFAAQAAPTN
ncbi:uncharacterized protein MONBRDRAFT_30548 [Monosiga brevicollis MX1]|uniref:Uncharacterized protein n=1 Tax=Monosiga brevicollis TaxID=81824 RepID=A9VEA1_MONBE|nr:uncharacterized protein MONBRDRAFT_30548 [Monosiga brevicollis MX1]EDQ84141.1 predicted protein [Monosiga brevicollis MX1]|eukprot:XP_001751048.1 hypothetical protein [Monosiga brevicollis MX1]